MITDSFYVFLIIFWTIHIIRRNFFWIYFWQKRGNHFHRFFNGLKENKRILISKSAIFASLLIFAYFFISKLENFFEAIVLSFYLLLGAYCLYLFFNSLFLKDFKSYFFVLPRFTKRTIVFSLFLVFWEVLFVFLLIFQKEKIVNEESIFLYFLIFEIVFPFFFIFVLGILKGLYLPIELWAQKKAKQKISEMGKLIVIGISGSYGKTIVKDSLYHMLSEKYKVLKTKGGETSKEGLVKLINKELTKKHDFLICEMSAFRVGEVRKTCQIIKPQIGILTGISEDRVSLFGNFKQLINTKYELINCLPEDGIAIFNLEDKECQKLYQRPNIKKYSYSTSEEKGDVFAKNILASERFVDFELVSWQGEEKMRLGFSNLYYLENFIGAATCALVLSLKNSQIKKITNKIKISGNFIVKRRGKNKTQIIDDTSNTKPAGFFDALKTLEKYQGKKIIIASCLSELGKGAFAFHNNIGKKIGEICDLAIITNPLFFKEIKLGAVSAGMKSQNILFLRHPKKILKALNAYFQKENTILLEGEISEKIKEYLVANDKVL